MTYSNLSDQNLKRIVSWDQYLVTLDEDGMFDLFVKDVLGDTLFDRINYSFVETIPPRRLFEMLKRNVKLEVAG